MHIYVFLLIHKIKLSLHNHPSNLKQSTEPLKYPQNFLCIEVKLQHGPVRLFRTPRTNPVSHRHCSIRSGYPDGSKQLIQRLHHKVGRWNKEPLRTYPPSNRRSSPPITTVWLWLGRISMIWFKLVQTSLETHYTLERGVV